MTYSTPIALFAEGEFLLSASTKTTLSGVVSEWWASKLYNGELYVAAHLVIPVYGTTPQVAQRRVAMIAPEIDQFVSSVSGGLGSGGSASPCALDHAMAHLNHYYPGLESQELLERTAVLYSLLSEFRIPKPAKVIAAREGVESVRTIHDRIARARGKGLIRPLGQGKSYI